MTDGFNQSEEFIDEEISEALDVDAGSVDLDQPGFQGLLPVLQAAREDALDMAVLVAWHNQLEALVKEALARLDGLQIEPALQAEAEPVLAANRATLEAMREVVGLLGDYLATAETSYLDRAILMLEETIEGVGALLKSSAPGR